MIYNKENLLSLEEIAEHRSKISRLDHLNNSLSFCKIKDGLILEFGVFEGKTINIISNFFKDEEIYGFDSFEGLPENWNDVENKVLKKGTFAVDNLPDVNSNVTLVKGWFDETLPDFIKQNQKAIKLLHIDCDLYSSTLTVLKLLNKFIVNDTIIVFDEIANWKKRTKLDEFNACLEWINLYNREIKFLSRSKSYQATFKVLK